MTGAPKAPTKAWLVTATDEMGHIVVRSWQSSEVTAVLVALRHRRGGIRATIRPALDDDRRRGIEADLDKKRRR